MRDAFWSLSFGPWILAATSLAALGAASLCFLTLRAYRYSLPARWLEGLRLAIILLILLTFYRPERVRRETHTDPPHVAVLVDASQSMETPDVLTPDGRLMTRAAWTGDALATQRWNRVMASGATLSIDRFSPVPTGPGGPPPASHGTDINRALISAAGGHGHLKAIALLSDGDANLGDPPAMGASLLRTRGIPVFTLRTGQDRHLPDLDLQSVHAPAYALVDEQVVIPFTLRSHYDREVRTRVRIVGDDGTDTSRDVRIPPLGQTQSAIVFTPRKEGEFLYTLSVPTEADEIQTDNNRREFQMALRREVLKVLLVDSRPRWEFRYLHNALARDPGVDVRCLLYHEGIQSTPSGNYLPRFPATREELSDFDVVFIGDVGIGDGELPESAPELLSGLVRQQGSGLVFMPGMRGRQATFAGTAFDDLMPIERDPALVRGVGAPLESRLALTVRGDDHLLTMLAADADANHAIWRTLPGFFWYDGVLRAKPSAAVLAVHETARNRFGRLPLLVTDLRGNGKVLYMGSDSAWRWRRGVEDRYHYRFWGQVVRWMAHQRHMTAQEGIRFFYHPENPATGERIFLHATVFDASGQPLKTGTTTVTLVAPSGRTEKVPLEAGTEGWGVFTGALTPPEGGDLRVTVNSPEAGRTLETRILVREQRLEVVGQPARTGTLREIADISGGAFFTTDQLDAMVEALQTLPEPQPREIRFRLWCHPLWVATLLGLLTIYWVGRKLAGML